MHCYVLYILFLSEYLQVAFCIFLCSFPLDISSIAYGSDPHVLALTDDGTIYAWGANGYGQLGRGSTSVHSNLPKPVNHALGGVTVSKVACGGFHSLALSNKGDVSYNMYTLYM